MRLTPLQTLAFYNAIANNGQLIKPRFLRAVKEFDRNIEVFDKEVLVDRICSDQTLFGFHTGLSEKQNLQRKLQPTSVALVVPP